MTAAAKLRKQRGQVVSQMVRCLPKIMSQKEVGAILGMTQQRVNQLEREIFWKIYLRMRNKTEREL